MDLLCIYPVTGKLILALVPLPASTKAHNERNILDFEINLSTAELGLKRSKCVSQKHLTLAKIRNLQTKRPNSSCNFNGCKGILIMNSG